jgi:hypothetical protein
MAFRSIGELAIEVLAELERVTADRSGGTDQPSMRSRAEEGGRPSAMRETGKMGEPKPPRVGQEDNQTKGRRPGGLAVLSYREHMPPALRLVSSRCMDRASPTRRPTVARSIHLRLVVDNGHDTAPKARRRWSSTKAQPTSVIPAMKP